MSSRTPRAPSTGSFFSAASSSPYVSVSRRPFSASSWYPDFFCVTTIFRFMDASSSALGSDGDADGQTIEPSGALVFEPVGELLDEMDAESADRALFRRNAEVRRLRGERIEGAAVVGEREDDVVGGQARGESDLVRSGVGVGVPEDVREDFLEHEGARVDDLLGNGRLLQHRLELDGRGHQRGDVAPEEALEGHALVVYAPA